MFDHAAWMNWPQDTYLAESKPYQLLIAHRCGFNIPNTLVGNVVSNDTNEPIIVKSLDTVLLREGNDCLFTYSTLTEDISEEASASAPFMNQEYIKDKIDIRVTIIGNKLYAIRILADGHPIAGDWRIMPKESLQYVNIALPQSIAESCMALTQNLGLAFAAIDLLEREGNYYFLEVNPTGEWGWLNSNERPFAALIADWLISP